MNKTRVIIDQVETNGAKVWFTVDGMNKGGYAVPSKRFEIKGMSLAPMRGQLAPGDVVLLTADETPGFQWVEDSKGYKEMAMYVYEGLDKLWNLETVTLR